MIYHPTNILTINLTGDIPNPNRWTSTYSHLTKHPLYILTPSFTLS